MSVQEFVACQTEEPGVLVLSPFAGAGGMMHEVQGRVHEGEGGKVSPVTFLLHLLVKYPPKKVDCKEVDSKGKKMETGEMDK